MIGFNTPHFSMLEYTEKGMAQILQATATDFTILWHNKNGKE